MLYNKAEQILSYFWYMVLSLHENNLYVNELKECLYSDPLTYHRRYYLHMSVGKTKPYKPEWCLATE